MDVTIHAAGKIVWIMHAYIVGTKATWCEISIGGSDDIACMHFGDFSSNG